MQRYKAEPDALWLEEYLKLEIWCYKLDAIVQNIQSREFQTIVAFKKNLPENIAS